MPAGRGRTPRLALLRFRRQRRNLSIRRIRDERGPQIGDNFAALALELVIRSTYVRSPASITPIAVDVVDSLLLIFGGFGGS